MRLEDYFRLDRFEDALDSFVRAKPHWPLKARYRLYRLAKTAFDFDATASPPSDEQNSLQRAATVELYDRLIDYWNILRPYSRSECWDGDRVYEALTPGCGVVSRASGIDLTNFDGNQLFDTVLACVSRLEGIKPMITDFPHMPASKLLHFFNPALFPIYDREEVWNNVCNGAFKTDYGQFCRQNGFEVCEPSARFNVYYTWWASDLMRTADVGIGSVFAGWFARQVGADPGDPIIVACSAYWGAMFEIAAIGAAHLCRSN